MSVEIEEIFNEETKTDKLNTTKSFQKTDQFYFNFQGIDPPKGIKFPVGLIIDFKDKSLESKEIPLPNQFADSNLILDCGKNLILPEEIGNFKLKFRTDEAVNVQILRFYFGEVNDQVRDFFLTLNNKIDAIQEQINNLSTTGGGAGNSGDKPPIETPSKRNRNKLNLR